MWLHADKVDLTQLQIPEDKFVNLDKDTRIAYKNIGKGPVVFCIPPWPSGSSAFVPFAHSVRQHLNIIALDLPGWGGYSSPMKEKPTLENYARLIAQFIEHFQFEEYSLLGYSFGGAMIQQMLKLDLVHPKKIVYVSTIHSGDDLERENISAIKAYRLMKSLHIPGKVIKELVALFVGKLTRLNKDKFYKYYVGTKIHTAIVEEDLRGDINAIFGALFSLIETELLNPDQAKIDSLVVYADSDIDFIKKGSREIAEFLEIVPTYLENVDHDHFTFDVNKSADIVLNFLLS